ncbi:uncharacterized protein LOC115342622 [Aquila chrysaetos chrysaetos]|uniref:uncharacterized protein LOC115342622 n=1 Tax=Aquila chrysaetos chrysaetos TaxID=223781 RepID=UPI00117657D7|nr:uncharacterized protein LOC115342622 [Aquila chrysaetos chrysaetos]
MSRCQAQLKDPQTLLCACFGSVPAEGRHPWLRHGTRRQRKSPPVLPKGNAWRRRLPLSGPSRGSTRPLLAHEGQGRVCQMGRRGGAEEETGEGRATVISLPGPQSKAVIKEGKWFKVPDLAMRVPERVFKRSHRSRGGPGSWSAKTAWNGKAASKHGPVCTHGAGTWPPVPRPLLAPPRSPQCQAARRDVPASPAPVQRGGELGESTEASRKRCLGPAVV